MNKTVATEIIKSAWDTEYADVVIYGTHDTTEAQALYTAYLTECGFAVGDEEWEPGASGPAFYEGMQKLWTLPKDDEEPFDTFAEPGEGREPYMVVSL